MARNMRGGSASEYPHLRMSSLCVLKLNGSSAMWNVAVLCPHVEVKFLSFLSKNSSKLSPSRRYSRQIECIRSLLLY